MASTDSRAITAAAVRAAEAGARALDSEAVGSVPNAEPAPTAPPPPRVEPTALPLIMEIVVAVKLTAVEVTAANRRAESAERRDRWWRAAAIVGTGATILVERFA